MTPATAAAAVREHGSIKAAARALGACPKTIRRHVAAAAGAPADTVRRGPRMSRPKVKYPVLPSSKRRVEELIASQVASFGRKHRRAEAVQGFAIRVPETRPYGVALFGDPHLDDPGCNWPRLLTDIQTVQQTDGLYCIIPGDVINNWPTGGKLAKKWADSSVTRPESYDLAEWFFASLAPKLLLTVAGNHDAWENGLEILSRVHPRAIPFVDWHADFRLVAANGRSVSVVCRHDFPGNSLWNETHGGLRAGKMTYDADVLISAHRHQYAAQQFEVHRNGKLAHVVRLGTYKQYDDYSEKLGFRPSALGAMTMLVIDPTAERVEDRVAHYPSIKQGLAALRGLRRAERAPRRRKAKSRRRS